jgi:hypothetical protein
MWHLQYLRTVTARRRHGWDAGSGSTTCLSHSMIVSTIPMLEAPNTMVIPSDMTTGCWSLKSFDELATLFKTVWKTLGFRPTKSASITFHTLAQRPSILCLVLEQTPSAIITTEWSQTDINVVLSLLGFPALYCYAPAGILHFPCCRR